MASEPSYAPRHLTGRRFPAIACALAGWVALASCAHGPRDGEGPAQGPARIVYSPHGEPLSSGGPGQPRCAEAMAAWFARLDPKGEGGIDQAAFEADARAQFSRMDLDHDGQITSAELSEYRRPFQPAPVERPEAGRRPGRDGAPPPRLIARTEDDSDPVMAADRHLRFRVSEADFLAHSADLFKALSRGGRIGRDALARLCPAGR